MQSIKSMPSSKSSWKFSNVNTLFRSSVASVLALGLLFSLLELAPVAEASSKLKATTVLAKIAIKGRAPKTGYDRALFSDGWGDIGECDTRNFILQRDLVSITWRESPRCTVATGILSDPYTAKTIYFVRGVGTSNAVQIDHVVPVSDAWQKGAQKLSSAQRYSFYNDPLNLLAVDGISNMQKSDSDAASWLPPNRKFWCSYVARQIAVKFKYHLWVTRAEHDSMARVLASCPGKLVPRG
ncbi:MAG: HNH endonuclease [Micrococcales bacterium]|nr:HNH endonuclease [Micrococcales bacterium]